MTPADLAVDELRYRRPRDKEDKSLEVYKFFVNALYVALTRAVKNLYLVESDGDHPLLRLLDVGASPDASAVTAQASTLEEWQREARKLELQGKQEQADAIRAGILKTTPVPWKVLDEAALREVVTKAFAPNSPSAKAKQTLYDFACVYGEPALARRLADQASFFPPRELRGCSFEAVRAQEMKTGADSYRRTSRASSGRRSASASTTGPPWTPTPLVLAAREGNVPLVEALLGRGARVDLVDAFGCGPVHHALARAYADASFARDRLGALYEMVAPQHVDLLVDGQRSPTWAAWANSSCSMP